MDLITVISRLSQLNPAVYLSFIGLLLTDAFLGMLAWRHLMGALDIRVSASKAYHYVWRGILVDMLIPAESVTGEIVKLALVTKAHNAEGGKVVGSIVMQRLMTMAINVIGLLIGLALIWAETPMTGFLLSFTEFFTGLTVAATIFVVVICMKKGLAFWLIHAAIGFAERLVGKRPRLMKAKEDLLSGAEAFYASMNSFRKNPRVLSESFLLLVGSWFFAWLSIPLIFGVLRCPVSSGAMIVVFFATLLVEYAPIVGLPFGVPELTMTTLLTMFGVPADVSILVTILSRITYFWLKLFLAFGISYSNVFLGVFKTHSSADN